MIPEVERQHRPISFGIGLQVDKRVLAAPFDLSAGDCVGHLASPLLLLLPGSVVVPGYGAAMTRVVASIDLEAPGRSCGYLTMSYSDNDHAYSVLNVPVAVLSGAPGPTVLLAPAPTATSGRDELIARQILEQVTPDELAGRIIVLPSHNLPAVRAASRCSPIDGENLNRAFPGDRDGGPTKMLADYVEAHLLPLCDYAMDLHSGGNASEYPAAAFLRIDDDLEEPR